MNETLKQEWDAIQQLEETLRQKKEQFQTRLEQEGYYLDESGNLQSNQNVVGLFWDFRTVDAVAPERGAFTTNYAGAIELTQQEQDAFKHLFKSKQFNKLLVLLEGYMNLEEDDHTLRVEHFKKGGIQDRNGVWKWISFSKGHMHQMMPNSTLIIKPTTKEEILKQNVQEVFETII